LVSDIREDHRLRVFENRVLRGILRPKRDEIKGGWGKLHNEELHSLYSLPNIIRMIKSRSIRWGGHVARMGMNINVYRFLMGTPEGKRSLGSPRHWWEDNIRMDLREVGCCSTDWIILAQDRDLWRAPVNTVMKLRVS
jgi:hypothetical protein